MIAIGILAILIIIAVVVIVIASRSGDKDNGYRINNDDDDAATEFGRYDVTNDPEMNRYYEKGVEYPDLKDGPTKRKP